MKNVLLTTTALVAFAGAAAAVEVAYDWSGVATLEYDVDTGDFSATADVDMDLTLTQELNNGMVASLALGGFAEWDEEMDAVAFDPSWIAMVETSYGSISFGDVDSANAGGFSSTAGMIVGDDVHEIGFGTNGHGVLATTTVGGISLAASSSYAGDLYAVNATGSMGTVDFGAFYEVNQATIEIDGNDNDETDDAFGDFVVERDGTSMGFFAGTTFGGLSVDVAYAQGDYTGCAYVGDEGDATGGSLGCETGAPSATSMGIALGYALTDAVSVSASYAQNTYNDDYINSINDVNPGDQLDDIALPVYDIASNDQIAVGIAYAAGAITASADYDVDAETFELAAGYTTEFAANMTATLGGTYDSDGDVFGGSLDIVYANGDNWAIHAGADTDDNVYAGIVYDLGGGASAYAYYADGDDEQGPEEWDAGTKLGLSISF